MTQENLFTRTFNTRIFLCMKISKFTVYQNNVGKNFIQQLNTCQTQQIDHLCQKFGVSNMTSTPLQQDFLRCIGLMSYRYLLNSEGNVQPFHNCKKNVIS